MSTIQRIDRATAKVIGEELAATIAATVAPKGLEITRRSGTYNPEANTYTLKVELHIAGTPDGLELNFRRYAQSFGFEPSDLGLHFCTAGGNKVFRIVGLDLRSRTRPIVAELRNVTQRPGEPLKRYKFKADVKKILIPRKVTTQEEN